MPDFRALQAQSAEADLASTGEERNHDAWLTIGGAMSECDDIESSGGRATLVALAADRSPTNNQPIRFNRKELNEILEVYGRKVADGEWRDYAIDQLKEKAVFSVFRRTSEVPLYRIEKQPRLARRQGAYALITATGLILRRGHDLANVLRVLEPRRLRLVEA
jgi:hypothetical protein